MYQIRFRLGLCPDPAGGAHSAPQTPIAGFKGILLRGGREMKGHGKGREKGEGGGEDGRGEGRGEEHSCLLCPTHFLVQ